MSSRYREALQRLVTALQLPSRTTDLTITFSGNDLPEMTIRQLLSQEQIEALAEWYVTEGIDKIQHGETYYTLIPRNQLEAQP
jgi:hypothetical protein